MAQEAAADLNLPTTPAIEKACDLYRNGKGNAKDFEHGYALFQKEAINGNPTARYFCGQMHHYGQGTCMDYNQAWSYYSAAANEIDAAYGRMGYMHEMGQGRSVDNEAAIKLYRKAARTDLESRCLLARHIIEGRSPGTESYAVEALEAGVAAKVLFATYSLGRYHVYGQLEQSDADYGLTLIQEANRLGYPKANTLLKAIEYAGTPLIQEGSYQMLDDQEEYSKAAHERAYALLKEVRDAYSQYGVDAGMQKLDEKWKVWHFDTEFSWPFYPVIWSDAQMNTAKEDPEWDWRVFEFLYLYGEKKAQQNKARNLKNPYFPQILLGNLAENQIAAGHLGKLKDTARIIHLGLLERNNIDSALKPIEDLHYRLPKLPQYDRFNMPIRQPKTGRVGFDSYYMNEEHLDYGVIDSIHTLARSEYLNGNWRQSLAYTDWSNRWLLSVSKHDFSEVRQTLEEVHEQEAELAIQFADIYQTLGFYERALNEIQRPISRDSNAYHGRTFHQASTLKALLQLELGIEIDVDMEGMKLLREKRAANKFDTKRAPYEVDLAIAAIMRQLGETENSKALLNQTVAIANETRLLLLQLRALRMRTLWALEDGEIEGVEADLIQALELCRDKGLKIAEPNLYYLYARSKIAQQELQEGIDLLLSCIDLYKSVDLYTWIPLRYIELAELYYRTGNFEQGNYNAALAKKLLDEDGAEYPQWIIDRSIEKLELLKSTLWTDKQPDAEKEGELSPINNSIPAYQAPSPGVASVDLQPLQIVAIPLENHPASGWFTVSNLSLSTQDVTLEAVGFVDSFVVSDLNEVSIELTPHNPQARIERSLQFMPQEQVIVKVAASSSDHSIRMNLNLKQGSMIQQSATFDYSENDTRSQSAIINASHIADNPFYMVSIFHTIQRQSAKVVPLINVRFKTSEPARIEGYGANGALLFVDNDGDGKFASQGDLLRSDQDSDGNVDLNFNEKENFTLFELRVLPHVDQTSQLIDISVEHEEGGQWHVDAIDSIAY